MSHMLKLIPAIMLSAVLTGCGGAEEDSEVAPYSQDQEPSTASLVLEAGENVHPGDRLRGAIVIALASGWHTYGDPPGDSGMPPAVSFTVPDGWSADLQPLPQSREFRDAAGVTFGYENELRIPFTVSVPENAEPRERAEIEVAVDWLVCKDVCLPQSALLTTEVTVSSNQ